MSARVMVFARIRPGDEAAFEAAFAEVSRRVQGTPGHVRDELLRDSEQAGSYVLLSEWESKEIFLAWHDAPGHAALSAPMRPFWAGRTERKIYEVAVRLGPT